MICCFFDFNFIDVVPRTIYISAGISSTSNASFASFPSPIIEKIGFKNVRITKGAHNLYQLFLSKCNSASHLLQVMGDQLLCFNNCLKETLFSQFGHLAI